jgi:hypothetical protein
LIERLGAYRRVCWLYYPHAHQTTGDFRYVLKEGIFFILGSFRPKVPNLWRRMRLSDYFWKPLRSRAIAQSLRQWNLCRTHVPTFFFSFFFFSFFSFPSSSVSVWSPSSASMDSPGLTLKKTESFNEPILPCIIDVCLVLDKPRLTQTDDWRDSR